MKWLIESNRWKHYIGIAIVAAVTFILLALLFCGQLTWKHHVIAAFVALAVAAAMEFKDVHHYNGDHVPIRQWDWSAWDWLDIAAGMLGDLTISIIVIIICLIL